MRRWQRCSLAVLVVVTALGGCEWTRERFSGKRALRHVETVCSFGPRSVGSEAHQKAAEYLGRVLERAGWDVETQDFAYEGQRLRNVIGKRGTGPLILLGTHYDTRPIADRDPGDRSQAVPGANDGASGVGVLLELARALDVAALARAEVWLVFFDGQSRGDIDGWPRAVGSRRLVSKMAETGEHRPEYVVILDMIGDNDQRFYYDWSATLWLQEKLWRIASERGYGPYFSQTHSHRVVNDHTPFLQWGVPAALLVDLDYPYWRTGQDTPDKISIDSLERVGDVLETMLEVQPFGTAWMSASDRSPSPRENKVP